MIFVPSINLLSKKEKNELFLIYVIEHV